jgi:AsmA protein
MGLLVLAAFAVKLFVNPNDYRGRIEQAVQRSTGCALQLPGELRFSVFPWLALELGPASLGNPAGFGSEPLATVQHVAVRVRLLPLLRRQLQVGRLEIDGLDLHLWKNAAGQGNWQALGRGAPASEPATAGAGPKHPSEVGSLRAVGGISIRNSRLRYQDTVVDQVNLTAGNFAAGTSTPVDLALKLTTGRGAAPMSWKFSSPDVRLDLSAQTLEVPAFASQLAQARLTGGLRAQRILDAPHVSGSFRLDPVSLRELTTALGISLPATRDPKALTSFAASGQFLYDDSAVRATDLDLRLDDSRLQGEAAITNLDTHAMSFDLMLDRIDIDRYLSPPSTPRAAVNTTMAPQAEPQTEANTFKKLQMKGAFSIGSAKVAGLRLSQVKVDVQSDDGIMHIAPMTARLYGGSLSADITLTAGASLGIRMQQSLLHVDVAALLQDLAATQRLSGRGNVTTQLTAQGWDAEDILKSLNGNVAANLTDGAVEGMDLWFEISRATALLQKQPSPSGSGSGRTRFDTFKASADLNNGVATTKDLSIASQNLHLSGQGSANLVTDQIDYRVHATVLKQLPGKDNASGPVLADIPLTVTGSMAKPQVRPDLEALARSRLQQELEQHQDEIKQKLQDTLKGLFK